MEALSQTLALRLWRVSIDTTTSPLEALELIRSYPYNVILCDVKMPVMTGLELLPLVHRLVPRAAMVLMSGHGIEETRDVALRAGTADYLHKPLDRNLLAARLKQILKSQHNARRELL